MVTAQHLRRRTLDSVVIIAAAALLAGCSSPTSRDNFGTLNIALGIPAVDDLSVNHPYSGDVADTLGKRRVARFLDSLQWRPKKYDIAPIPADWTITLLDRGEECGTIDVYILANSWRFHCPEAQYVADSPDWNKFIKTLVSSDRAWLDRLSTGYHPSHPCMLEILGKSPPTSAPNTAASRFEISPFAVGIGLGVLTFCFAGWLSVKQFGQRDKNWRSAALLAILGLAATAVSIWQEKSAAAVAKTLKQDIAIAKRKANEIEARRIADLTGIITLTQSEALAAALQKIQSQAEGQLQATVIAANEFKASWRYARTLAEIMAEAKLSPPSPAELAPIPDFGITIYAQTETALVRQLADALALTDYKPHIFTAGIPNWELENSPFKTMEELLESNRKAAPEKTHVLIVVGFL